MSSRKEQFILLSSISNFHHFGYPSLTEATRIIKLTHVNYIEHILYDPDAKENVEGHMICKYIPTSPRNRLMYLLVVGHSQLWNLMKYLQTCDSETHTGEQQQDIADEIEFVPPAPKRCKQGPRIVSVTAGSIVQEVGADLNSVLNSADSNHTIYKTFKEQVVTEGIICWCYHDDTTDVCIMNDINTATGYMMPNAFVHITCCSQPDQDSIIKCTCTIFDLIQRSAKQQTNLLSGDEQQELILDGQLTCMHCTFYKEFLTQAYFQATHQTAELPRGVTLVQDSLSDMNMEIQLVQNVAPSSSTKFSVQGTSSSFSIVSLTFPHGKICARCSNGMCGVAMRNRKSIPKNATKEDRNCMLAHQNYVQRNAIHGKYFPRILQRECTIRW